MKYSLLKKKLKNIFISIFFRKITRPKFEALLKNYASEKKTLDIGSSDAPYKKYFPNSICLDVVKKKNVDVVGDAHNLPFPDNSFEIVLLTHVLDDCEDPFRVASEIMRVLKPGGIVILSVPFIYPINDGPLDYWRFTPYSLRLLFKGMNEIEMKPVLRQFETIALIFQRLAFQGRGSRIKRLFFAFLALIIDISRIDNLIEQSGYPSIHREKGTEVGDIMAALYFAVFEKGQ